MDLIFSLSITSCVSSHTCRYGVRIPVSGLANSNRHSSPFSAGIVRDTGALFVDKWAFQRAFLSSDTADHMPASWPTSETTNESVDRDCSRCTHDDWSQGERQVHCRCISRNGTQSNVNLWVSDLYHMPRSIQRRRRRKKNRMPCAMYMERQVRNIHRGLNHAELSFILELHNNMRRNQQIWADWNLDPANSEGNCLHRTLRYGNIERQHQLVDNHLQINVTVKFVNQLKGFPG